MNEKCYNCKFASVGFKVVGKTHHHCSEPKQYPPNDLREYRISPWDTLREWYDTCEHHKLKIEIHQTMKIKDLQPGALFKMTAKQRKFRTFTGSRALPDREGIPNSHRGKMLVFFDGCKQWVADPEMDVIVNEDHAYPTIEKPLADLPLPF